MSDITPALPEWFSARFDDAAIFLDVRPPGGAVWQAQIDWARIIRVCFRAGDLFESDEIYIFTDERPESYLVPIEAGGGQALRAELITRGLFDAELAIQAATAANELFCWEP